VSSSCATSLEKLRKSRLTFGAGVILDLGVGFIPGATSPDCRNALISCISVIGNALMAIVSLLFFSFGTLRIFHETVRACDCSLAGDRFDGLLTQRREAG
jgi:hypothetical protein